MTNSEILNAILEKYVPEKTSQLKKTQILELSVEFGTSADIKKVFDRYSPIDFVNGALSIACEFADKSKVKTLLSCGARFKNEYTPYEKGIYGSSTNYMLSISSRYKTYYPEKDSYIAVKVAGTSFSTLSRSFSTPQDRAEIIKLIESSSLNKNHSNYSFSNTLLQALLLGDIELINAAENNGIIISEKDIKLLNAPNFNLHNYLLKLNASEQLKVLTELCRIASIYKIQIKPAKGMLTDGKALLNHKFLAVMVEKCDLSRLNKSDVVCACVETNCDDILRLLEELGFLNSPTVRNEALKKAEKFPKSKKWLLDSQNRILTKVAASRPIDRKANDSENADWFTHKGNMLIGFSKKGIKEITARHLTSITLPERIDGREINEIRYEPSRLSNKDVPCLEELIIPSQYEIENVTTFSRDYYGPFPAEPGFKKLTFLTNKKLFFNLISRSIENIEIRGSRKYKTVNGVVYNHDLSELLYYPSGRKGENYVVPSTVKKIVGKVFERCSLNSLTISDSVINIDKRCAWDSSIKHLEIGGNVKTIPEDAFSSCKGLNTLVLHEGIETIDESAFKWCSANEVVIPKSIKRINKDAFMGSHSHFVFLSDDVLIGPHAFYCNPRRKKDYGYSEKIEGKMYRCGTIPYDYYDEYCGIDRDRFIRYLCDLNGKPLHVSEKTRLDEILERIEKKTKLSPNEIVAQIEFEDSSKKQLILHG